MRNAYRYKRLEGSDYFRLLQINTTRSRYRKRLKYQYSLMHTRLDNAPPYETLSYVWGTTVQDAPLPMMDGTSLLVTKALDVILPRIAQHCDTKYLWIDQICIDQHNVEERGQQVSIMGNIYSNCVQVIVWLEVKGRARPELPSLFEMANRLLDTAMQSPDLTLLQSQIRSIKVKLSSFNEVSWGLYHILSCVWFSRAWVFQEVVLAPVSKVIISWPSARKEIVTSLYKLYWILEAITNCYDIRQDTVLCFDEARLISTEMYRQWSERHLVCEAADGISFVRLLSAVISDAKTSLELDRLYAFFGLNSQSSVVLQPDYEVTFEQALTTTVRAIIKGTLRIDLFGLISIRRHYPRSLPSWVPDLGEKELLAPFRPTLAKARTDGAQTSNSHAQAGIIYPWAGSCDTRTLRVHGKKIDTAGDHMYFRFDRWKPFEDEDSLLGCVLAHIYPRSDHHFEDSNYVGETMLAALKAGGWCGNASDSSCNEAPRPTTELDSTFGIMQFRAFYTTRQGLVVMGLDLRKDDTICILHGCSHPVALRPVEGDAGKYNVLGTCYLEGWMDPWANGKIYWAEDEADEFILV